MTAGRKDQFEQMLDIMENLSLTQLIAARDDAIIEFMTGRINLETYTMMQDAFEIAGVEVAMKNMN